MKRETVHAHSHSHAHNQNNNTEGKIGLAFLLNLSFSVIEMIGGVATNSVAIISDSVHDFGDSISLAMAWYFQRLSKKGRTKKYTYGYRRFSLLGAMINSAILVIGSMYIISEAAQRLMSPQSTNAAGMFVLAIIGILVNGFAVLRTYKAKSLNERVVSLHLLEDVLGWAAVLVGSAIMHFTGLTIIDPILSLGIAMFILVSSFKSLRQVIYILLQGSPSVSAEKEITDKLLTVKGVDNLHDLHIWSLDEGYSVATVHVVLDEGQAVSDLPKVKRKIRKLLDEEGVQHATIEFEARGESCSLANC